VSAECPCGRPRTGCTYHDPALQPATKPRVVEYDPAKVGPGDMRDVVVHGTLKL
jgi:hypothetical protein